MLNFVRTRAKRIGSSRDSLIDSLQVVLAALTIVCFTAMLVTSVIYVYHYMPAPFGVTPLVDTVCIGAGVLLIAHWLDFFWNS